MEKKMQEGPELISLTRRLLDISLEFENQIWEAKGNPDFASGQIHLYAMYGDLIRYISGNYPSENDYKFFFNKQVINKPNYQRIILIAIYLLFDPWFKNRKGLKVNIDKLLHKQLLLYNDIVQANSFVKDAERREEFVRVCLFHLGFYPMGEEEKKSFNRLLSVDSIERQRVVAETKAAQVRAQQLRDEMAARAAEEAASKPSGE